MARRAGISVGHLCELEGGLPVSLETYARVLTALDLKLALGADPVEPARARQGQDLVHAAMGELEARRLRSFGFAVAIDEPYQHYQFAGRADVVAWDLEARAMLHIENRTQFPNVQEALGSFGAKRAYLGHVLAERVGIGRRGWASETHVIAALWSSEVLHVLRLRETTFRVTCPDPADAFHAWWSGTVPASRGSSSALVLVDPATEVSERRRFATMVGLHVRPRYADYAAAARVLSAER